MDGNRAAEAWIILGMSAAMGLLHIKRADVLIRADKNEALMKRIAGAVRRQAQVDAASGRDTTNDEFIALIGRVATLADAS